jgi:hypothetical protein
VLAQHSQARPFEGGKMAREWKVSLGAFGSGAPDKSDQ